MTVSNNPLSLLPAVSTFMPPAGGFNSGMHGDGAPGTSAVHGDQFAVGDTVAVAPRLMPGINRPGGVGHVSAVTEGETGCTYDVKYLFGGRETGLSASILTRYEPEPAVEGKKLSRTALHAAEAAAAAQALKKAERAAREAERQDMHQRAVAAHASALDIIASRSSGSDGNGDRSGGDGAEPAKLGVLRVASMGAVDPRPGFHSQRELWPLGFAATGTFALDPGAEETFSVEVLDGGARSDGAEGGPLFRVALVGPEGGASDDGDAAGSSSGGGGGGGEVVAADRDRGVAFEARSGRRAWSQMIKQRRTNHTKWRTTRGALACLGEIVAEGARRENPATASSSSSLSSSSSSSVEAAEAGAVEREAEDEEEGELLKSVAAALRRKASLAASLAAATRPGGPGSERLAGTDAEDFAEAERVLGVGLRLALPDPRAFLGEAAALAEGLPGAAEACGRYIFAEERERVLAKAKAQRLQQQQQQQQLQFELQHQQLQHQLHQQRGGGEGGFVPVWPAGGSGQKLRRLEKGEHGGRGPRPTGEAKETLKRAREDERDSKKKLSEEDKRRRREAREFEAQARRDEKEAEKKRREKSRDAEKVARGLRRVLESEVSKLRTAAKQLVQSLGAAQVASGSGLRAGKDAAVLAAAARAQVLGLPTDPLTGLPRAPPPPVLDELPPLPGRHLQAGGGGAAATAAAAAAARGLDDGGAGAALAAMDGAAGSALLTVWDFLVGFQDELGGPPPALGPLCRALLAAERRKRRALRRRGVAVPPAPGSASGDGGGNCRDDDEDDENDDKDESTSMAGALHECAVRLVAPLLPDLFEHGLHLPAPAHGALVPVNEWTWPSLASAALLQRAHRDLGTDPGEFPLHVRGGSGGRELRVLAAERHAVQLARLRVARAFEELASPEDRAAAAATAATEAPVVAPVASLSSATVASASSALKSSPQSKGGGRLKGGRMSRASSTRSLSPGPSDRCLEDSDKAAMDDPEEDEDGGENDDDENEFDLGSTPALTGGSVRIAAAAAARAAAALAPAAPDESRGGRSGMRVSIPCPNARFPGPESWQYHAWRIEGMASNSGKPIRNTVLKAIECAQREAIAKADAAKASGPSEGLEGLTATELKAVCVRLEACLGPDVFKSNATGPCKQAVQAVLDECRAPPPRTTAADHRKATALRLAAASEREAGDATMDDDDDNAGRNNASADFTAAAAGKSKDAAAAAAAASLEPFAAAALPPLPSSDDLAAWSKGAEEAKERAKARAVSRLNRVRKQARRAADRAAAAEAADATAKEAELAEEAAEAAGPDDAEAREAAEEARAAAVAAAAALAEEDEEDEDFDEEDDDGGGGSGGAGRDSDPDGDLSWLEGEPEAAQRCWKVLAALAAHPSAAGFLEPVDPREAPDYYDFIARPVSIASLRQGLREGVYFSRTGSGSDGGGGADEVARGVSRFARDVRLMFANCRCYNLPGTFMDLARARLSAVFERVLLSWVLAPPASLPLLSECSDDACFICRRASATPAQEEKKSHKKQVASSPEHEAVQSSGGADADGTLLCDRCDGKCHLHCLDPPLAAVPEGAWFCGPCIAQAAGTSGGAVGGKAAPVAWCPGHAGLDDFDDALVPEALPGAGGEDLLLGEACGSQGVRSLGVPPRLDPLVCSVAAAAASEDEDYLSRLHALRLLLRTSPFFDDSDDGEGGDNGGVGGGGWGAEEWLSVLGSLVDLVSGAMEPAMVARGKEATELTKEVIAAERGRGLERVSERGYEDDPLLLRAVGEGDEGEPTSHRDPLAARLARLRPEHARSDSESEEEEEEGDDDDNDDTDDEKDEEEDEGEVADGDATESDDEGEKAKFVPVDASAVHRAPAPSPSPSEAMDTAADEASAGAAAAAAVAGGGAKPKPSSHRGHQSSLGGRDCGCAWKGPHNATCYLYHKRPNNMGLTAKRSHKAKPRPGAEAPPTAPRLVGDGGLATGDGAAAATGAEAGGGNGGGSGMLDVRIGSGAALEGVTVKAKRREQRLQASVLWRRVVAEFESPEECVGAAKFVFFEYATGGSASWAAAAEDAERGEGGGDGSGGGSGGGAALLDKTLESSAEVLATVRAFRADPPDSLCAMCGLSVASLCSPLLALPRSGRWVEADVHAAAEAQDPSTSGGSSSSGGGSGGDKDALQDPVHYCCALWAAQQRSAEAAKQTEAALACDVVEPALLCGRGRTRSLGHDRRGHAFWVFSGAPHALHVQLAGQGRWARFEDPSAAALALDPTHPLDAKILRLLPLRCPPPRRPRGGGGGGGGGGASAAADELSLSANGAAVGAGGDSTEDEADDEGGFKVGKTERGFKVGEVVWVDKGAPWGPAEVVATEKRGGEWAFLVRHKGWGSRSDEWCCGPMLRRDGDPEARRRRFSSWVEAHYEAPEPPPEGGFGTSSDLDGVRRSGGGVLPPVALLHASSFGGKPDRNRPGAHAALEALAKRGPGALFGAAPGHGRAHGTAKEAVGSRAGGAPWALALGLLAFEASLPAGAVEASSSSSSSSSSSRGAGGDQGTLLGWTPAFAARWALVVAKAGAGVSAGQGVGGVGSGGSNGAVAARLMECLVCLEDALRPGWLLPAAAGSLKGLPSRAGALRGPVSLAAVAQRLFVLDGALQYDKVLRPGSRTPGYSHTTARLAALRLATGGGPGAGVKGGKVRGRGRPPKEIVEAY